MLDRIIIHVDMDAFFASVESRDDPSLRGKPLIIGSLPNERGVVSTCSYEARKYGVHSAMNIREAYDLCPDGVYMHPNFDKYIDASDRIHGIWESYTDRYEYIALDEGYLDVTETAGTFERAAEMGREIKRRVLDEIGLTCSVGVAYCMAAAKAASEEKKPDGFFEIRTPGEFVSLMEGRSVRELFSVGEKTAQKLNAMCIYRVRDIPDRSGEIIREMGKHGRMIVDLAHGVDDREVTPWRPEDSKSVSREITFQRNVADVEFLRDVLLLLSYSVADRAARRGTRGCGVTLKITYSDMETITKSRSVPSSDDPFVIYRETVSMLYRIPRHLVRLIGVGIVTVKDRRYRQTTLDDVSSDPEARKRYMENSLADLSERYGLDFEERLPHLLRLDNLHKTVETMRVRAAPKSTVY